MFCLVEPNSDPELQSEITTCATSVTHNTFSSTCFEQLITYSTLLKAVSLLKHTAKSFSQESHTNHGCIRERCISVKTYLIRLKLHTVLLNGVCSCCELMLFHDLFNYTAMLLFISLLFSLTFISVCLQFHNKGPGNYLNRCSCLRYF